MNTNPSDDVLGEIFLYLPLHHLAKVFLVSKHMYEIANAETQWKQIARYLFLSEDKSNEQSWKEYVRNLNNGWSNSLIDSLGQKYDNTFNPIIRQQGRSIRFPAEQEERVYCIANTSRAIPTSGTFRLDFKITIHSDDPTYLSSSFVLLGIADERILKTRYKDHSVSTHVYLAEFPEYENLAYANNGYSSRCHQTGWTHTYGNGDIISICVDADFEREEAEKSGWKKPFGCCYCMRNYEFQDTQRFLQIFVDPDDKLYCCLQVNESVTNEDRKEGLIEATIVPITNYSDWVEKCRKQYRTGSASLSYYQQSYSVLPTYLRKSIRKSKGKKCLLM
jgi:hypothetical protein